MSNYNFKKIKVVPSAQEFKNIVLSMVQRKTPTEVHKHYEIGRIRKFYDRKVKFAAQSFRDRLKIIIEEFPLIDNIHPFYRSLLDTLYDKEHYKIALAHINRAISMIDERGKEYVRLIKYGDSLYQCKSLKIAALGRMAKIISSSKQREALEYLENVRQHLSRLPSINPESRTLLLCGFPNVGKSSFINTITRADVEVQPYAFTTKSIYVGHTDYEYLQWQVIDTPGILDQSLEDKGPIEMLAITALSHLHAVNIFIMDISEQCGYSLEQQINLYKSIQPVFRNRPKLIAVNKIDVIRPEELTPEQRELFSFFKEEKAEVMFMSTQTNEGVSEVRNKACDILKEMRLEKKLANPRLASNRSRIEIVYPESGPNSIKPVVTIPSHVIERRIARLKSTDPTSRKFLLGKKPKISNKKLEKEIEAEKGLFYTTNNQQNYDSEIQGVIRPEIFNGVNIIDYVVPDLKEKLEELRLDDQMREARGDYANPFTPDTEEEKQSHTVANAIREKISIRKINARIDGTTKSRMPRQGRKRERSESRLRGEMSELGVDVEDTKNSHLGRSKSRSRSMVIKKARTDSEGRVRSSSKMPRDKSGIRDPVARKKAIKLVKKGQVKMNRNAKRGEADRQILDLKPKHLFSGKRGSGTSSHR